MGRPTVGSEVVALVRTMALANPLGRAPHPWRVTQAWLQHLAAYRRRLMPRRRKPVVCQNRSPRLDDGSAACEPWTAMSLALALWRACARRSEPAPTLHSRTWRSDSSSPCSAVDQSDRDSGASIAPSGYGSPTGGLDGARRSISYAPRP